MNELSRWETGGSGGDVDPARLPRISVKSDELTAQAIRQDESEKESDTRSLERSFGALHLVNHGLVVD